VKMALLAGAGEGSVAPAATNDRIHGDSERSNCPANRNRKSWRPSEADRDITQSVAAKVITKT